MASISVLSDGDFINQTVAAALSSSNSTASSCEACGWLAAFCSALAFGSFGVPIKSRAAVQVDIDPLVFQSYKTLLCFLTSWLVLLITEFSFSPWGIVSGLFWVPGGVATVYAVKSAGLAIGIGIGSSCIVLVSFIWGIFIFQEPVRSKWGASFAVFCMMMGLMGMSYFSSPEAAATTADRHAEITTIIETAEIDENKSRASPPPPPPPTPSDDSSPPCAAAVRRRRQCDLYRGLATREEDGEIINDDDGESPQPTHDESQDAAACGSAVDNNEAIEETFTAVHSNPQQPAVATTLTFCGICLTKRQWGMLAAVYNGLWGGSILVPMKWCTSDDTKGIHYLISFAIGASVVTLWLWVMRFGYNCYHHGRTGGVSLDALFAAYQQLPSFHWRVMWLPGGLSGLLWSIGNFFSLISVYYLGEGVGYPLVQTAILISGLWGIFYFHEVTGTARMTKWFFASCLTVFGILLLSYEHRSMED